MSYLEYQPILRTAALCVALALASSIASAAPNSTIDQITFGDVTSESGHSLTAYFPTASSISTVPWSSTPAPSDPSTTQPSDVVAGAMGLSARRLLPRGPNPDVYGGQINFTMAVDPVKQNYFSLKLWGSDPDPGGGYLILDINGKEVGGRHGGSSGILEDPLYFYGSGWYPNLFFIARSRCPCR